MSELGEMQENAEHVHHDSSLLGISFSAAVLAVLVAMVTLLGHRAHTEELLLQSKSTDAWAEYQAKSIRENTAKSFGQLLTVLSVSDAVSAKKLRDDFDSKATGYGQDKEKLKEQATELEKEQALVKEKADRFDSGEAALEMALVITSVALITKRRQFWYFGLIVGMLGVGIALMGFLRHA